MTVNYCDALEMLCVLTVPGVMSQRFYRPGGFMQVGRGDGRLLLHAFHLVHRRHKGGVAVAVAVLLIGSRSGRSLRRRDRKFLHRHGADGIFVGTILFLLNVFKQKHQTGAPDDGDPFPSGGSLKCRS